MAVFAEVEHEVLQAIDDVLEAIDDDVLGAMNYDVLDAVLGFLLVVWWETCPTWTCCPLRTVGSRKIDWERLQD